MPSLGEGENVDEGHRSDNGVRNDQHRNRRVELRRFSQGVLRGNAYDAGVWRRSIGRMVLLCILSSSLACDDGGGPLPRAFGSRQVLPIRDSMVGLGTWNGMTWYFFRGDHYWSLDFDTGEAHDLGLQLPVLDFSTGSTPRYDCVLSVDGGGSETFIITDRQNDGMTIIDRIGGTATCPTDTDPNILAWRFDEAGTLQLWAGPFDQLVLQPTDVDVKGVLFTTSQEDTHATGFWVLGATRPDALGVYALDPPSFGSREVMSPELGPSAWATGAEPDGPLVSTSLSNKVDWGFAGTGHFTYMRRMSDGGATMFVGPYETEPRELALFRTPAAATLEHLQLRSFDGNYLYRDTVWLEKAPGGSGSRIIFWNDAKQQLVNCASPFTQTVMGTFDPDQEWLALRVFIDSISYGQQGGALVMMGSNGCHTLAPDDVSAFVFSPDRTATTWLVQPATGSATLWTGGRDGSNARVVGTGEIAGPPDEPRFVGPSELQLELGGDLAWIDVHDDPVRMHYVAERTFGRPIDLPDNAHEWQVIGYDRSGQDATGTLGLVNRRTGAKRQISREVRGFEELGHPFDPKNLNAPPPDPWPVRVVYMVQGRNPSEQDGIWIATINESDVR